MSTLVAYDEKTDSLLASYINPKFCQEKKEGVLVEHNINRDFEESV